jgi:hypothetical protein
VRALPNRDGRYLVVEGKSPSKAELARVVREDLGIHILKAPRDSLEFLSPIIAAVRRLIVTDRSCSNVSLLAEAAALRELDLWVVSAEEVAFHGMPGLERFVGFGKKISGVRALGHLSYAYIEGANDTTLLGAQGPLRDITLTRASALTALPRIEHPEHVSTMLIHGARRLDLSTLVGFPNLKKLTLASCKNLTGVSGLLVSGLNHVELDRCPSIDEWESLLDLRAGLITVADLNPFTEDFRAQAELASPGRWTFPRGSIVAG